MTTKSSALKKIENLSRKLYSKFQVQFLQYTCDLNCSKQIAKITTLEMARYVRMIDEDMDILRYFCKPREISKP